MSWRLGGRRAIATAVAVGALQACGDLRGEDPPGVAAGTQGYTRVVNVEVERIVPRSFTRSINLPGVAMAMRDVVVSAEEAGVVRRIVRDKGQPIRTGQAIVRFDDAILRAQVQSAAAQAQYDEEVWERRKKLYEEDSIGSELSYHEAHYTAEQSRGNLAALQERLARTTVSAPISGILNDRLVEIGSAVSPGMAVARIVQTDTVRVVAGAPERFALDLPVGAAATVTLDVLADQAFEGAVTYVGAVVDADSRTFPIELTLPNPDALIKPGMIAEISVVQEEIVDAIVVPQQALVAMEDGRLVVRDLRHRAYHVFDPNGDFERMVRMGGNPSLTIAGLLMAQRGANAVITTPHGSRAFATTMNTPDGRIPRRDPATSQPIELVSLAGEEIVTDTMVDAWLPPGREGVGPNIFGLPRPLTFDPRLHWGVLPDGSVAFADSTTYAIKIAAAGTGISRVLTRPFTPEPMTGPRIGEEKNRRLRELEAIPDEELGRTGSVINGEPVRRDPGVERERRRENIENLEFFYEVPVIGGLFVGLDGTIWVRRRGEEPASNSWPVDLVMPDGRYLGT